MRHPAPPLSLPHCLVIDLVDPLAILPAILSAAAPAGPPRYGIWLNYWITAIQRRNSECSMEFDNMLIATTPSAGEGHRRRHRSSRRT